MPPEDEDRGAGDSTDGGTRGGTGEAGIDPRQVRALLRYANY